MIFNFFKRFLPEATIGKNFFWLAAGQLGTRFFKAAITIYAARVLGSAGYGVFSYVFGLAGFFIFFKNIGIDSILTREIAKNPEREKEYLSTAFWIEIFLLIITAGLILFVAPFWSTIPEATALLPLAAIVFIADDLKDLFVAFFRGKERMEFEAIVTTVLNMGMAIFGVALLYIHPFPASLVGANVIASLSALFVSFVIILKLVKGGFYHFNKKLVVPFLKSAWPLALGGVMSIFLFNVDIIMLGWWRTAADVGFYSAAQKLVGILHIIVPLLAVSTFSALSRSVAKGEKKDEKKLMGQTVRFIYLLAIPLVVGGFIVREPLITLVFGAEYLPAVNIFGIIIISILATYPFPMFSNYIFAHDKQLKMLFPVLLASALNVGINAVLIPVFGPMGAAVATLSANAVYAIWVWRITVQLGARQMFRGLGGVLTATAVMAIVALGLQSIGLNVLLNIALSALIYIGVLYSLKDNSLNEASELLGLRFGERK